MKNYGIYIENDLKIPIYFVNCYMVKSRYQKNLIMKLKIELLNFFVKFLPVISYFPVLSIFILPTSF